MIVGNGLIGKAFYSYDREDVVFFASGVSNSLETDRNQFQREENLIRKTIAENPEKLFVYFSTCSIYDSSKNDSRYVLHKLNMEHIISTEVSNYLIARVSNAVGSGGNPNLLMNYVNRAIDNGDTIHIHRFAKRNLIDVEDVKSIVLHLIDSKKEKGIYNVAFLRNFSIEEIVESFESFKGKTAVKEFQDKGESYSISIDDLGSYFLNKDLEKNGVYLKKMLHKYY